MSGNYLNMSVIFILVNHCIFWVVSYSWFTYAITVSLEDNQELKSSFVPIGPNINIKKTPDLQANYQTKELNNNVI